MVEPKNPSTAMMVSAVLPGGGQLYSDSFGSALLVWVGIAVVGWLAFSAHEAQDKYAEDSRVGYFASEEQIEAARVAGENADRTAIIEFVLWTLLFAIWASNVWDAKKTAVKWNAKNVQPPTQA